MEQLEMLGCHRERKTLALEARCPVACPTCARPVGRGCIETKDEAKAREDGER